MLRYHHIRLGVEEALKQYVGPHPKGARAFIAAHRIAVLNLIEGRVPSTLKDILDVKEVAHSLLDRLAQLVVALESIGRDPMDALDSHIFSAYLQGTPVENLPPVEKPKGESVSSFRMEVVDEKVLREAIDAHFSAYMARRIWKALLSAVEGQEDALNLMAEVVDGIVALASDYQWKRNGKLGERIVELLQQGRLEDIIRGEVDF